MINAIKKENMDKEDIFKLIVEHVCDVLPELENHDFQQTDSLKDLGANSLDRAEIVMMVMESLTLDIPRIELLGVNNLGELTTVIYNRIQTV